MKLEEVCKAFIEGAKLVDEDNNEYLKGEKAFINNNIPTTYPFAYPEYMKKWEEYNLTFLEAIMLAKEGGKVANKINPKDIYKYKGGTIVDKYDCPCLGYEQKADWKVVK